MTRVSRAGTSTVVLRVRVWRRPPTTSPSSKSTASPPWLTTTNSGTDPPPSFLHRHIPSASAPANSR